MNMKKKVLPVLTASGRGASSWARLMKGVGMIREASDPKVLQEMWEDLLEEWIPSSDGTRSIRNYMHNYVWSQPKKWDTACFEDLLTCGAMNTQRSEGSRAALKKHANLKGFAGLFDSIHNFVARQYVSKLERVVSSQVLPTCLLRSLPTSVHCRRLFKIQHVHRTVVISGLALDSHILSAPNPLVDTRGLTFHCS